MAPPTADDRIANLKRQSPGFVTSMARCITNAERLVQSCKGPLSDLTIDALKKSYEDLDRAQGKLADIYKALIELTGGDDKEKYQEKLSTVDEDYLKTRDLILEVLNDNTAATMSPQVQAPPVLAQAARRIDNTLKPETLNLEFTPGQFREWLRSFKGWFNINSMGALPIHQQQLLLHTILDDRFKTYIETHTTGDTPVYDQDGRSRSCLDVVEEYFALQYPLIRKRLLYHRYKQPRGMAFTDYVHKLRQLGTEADVHKLTVDESHCFMALTGCNDSKLRQKILSKLKTINLEDMMEEASRYEAAQILTEVLDETPRSRRLRGPQQERPKQGRHRQSGRERSRIDPRREFPGLCIACGKEGHKWAKCPNKKDLQCTNCNKNGHVAKVCFKGITNRSPSRGRQGRWTRPQSRNRPTAASRQTSPGREADEDTPEEDEAACIATLRAIGADSISRATPKLEIKINCHQGKNLKVLALPDTGTTATMLSKALLDKHGIKPKPTRHKVRMAANDTYLQCAGSLEFVCTLNNGNQHTIQAIVAENLTDDVLLSWHDMIGLGILPNTWPKAIPTTGNCTRATRAITEEPLQKLKKEYMDVLSDDLLTLKGKTLDTPPMKIQLNDEPVKPLRIVTARQIPLHLQEQANQKIKDLLEAGIIRPVTESTEWISPGHFVKEKKGVRFTTDYVQLNRRVRRPVHPFPSVTEVRQAVRPDSKVFAVFDCKWGYFQRALDKPSQLLTTFLIPQGKFCYTRAPMGLNASGDEFCQATDTIIAGLEGITKLVDDLLIQAPDEVTLYKRVRALLERAREHGMTLSKEKIQWGRRVKFAGFLVTDEGVKPDPEKVEKIKKWPAPKNIHELRSFLGLANQFGSFMPDLAHLTATLRPLTGKNQAYNWLDDIHGKAFEEIKEALTSDAIVKPFDPAKPVELHTDASRHHGLGYILLQPAADGRLALVDCHSRSLTPAESRYATIELELLAVQWAVERCSYYLYGLSNFTVVVDHRPLQGLFKKHLPDIPNPRLLRIREKLQGYSFDVTWVPGKQHAIADALSRMPKFSPPEDGEDLDREIYGCLAVVEITDDPLLGPLFEAASADPRYQQVVEALRQDQNPSTLAMLHPARAYKAIWNELSILTDKTETHHLLVFDGRRLIVPPKARTNIIDQLHIPHGGIVKTLQAAKERYFWHGLKAEITERIEKCHECQQNRKANSPEPLNQTTATSAMEQLSADLFDLNGNQYLVIVDRFSGYPFVSRLKRTNTEAIVKEFEAVFDNYGLPRRIRTDGGPQFRGPFANFCSARGIIHEKTSPYHPASNGHAEAAVKSMKGLLRKCEQRREPYEKAIVAWRNLPRADGFSPAAMFLGRSPRTLLPEIPRGSTDLTQASEARREMQNRVKREHDKRAKELPKLNIGDQVRIRHPTKKMWTDIGTISGIRPSGSYEVTLEDGSQSCRSRQFLNPIRTGFEPATNTPPEPIKSALRRSDRLASKKIRFM